MPSSIGSGITSCAAPHTTVDRASVTRSAADLYRTCETNSFALGRDTVAVYSSMTGGVVVMPADECRRLRSCNDFDTIDRHAERIARSLSVDVDDVRASLGRLVAKGLLVPYSEVVQASRGAGSRATAGSSLSTVAFPTRDRVASLQRALESYADNFAASGRALELLVFDDSREQEQRQAYMTVLQQVHSRRNVSIRYAGASEKRVYVSSLSKMSGVPADLILFAMFGDPGVAVSHGANRNAMLFDTVGERFLCFDDDTVCRVAVSNAGSGASLRLGGELDPAHVTLLADRCGVEAGMSTRHVDVVSEHEQVLGRPVADVIDAFAQHGPVDAAASCTHLMKSLRSGRARIVATFNGLIGDCGRTTAMGPLELIGRGLVSDREWQLASVSRSMLRVVPETVIWHGGGWMNFATGLDHRELLPPFMPVARSEDLTFYTLLRACVPDAFFAYLPSGLLHDPMEVRGYQTPTNGSVPLADVVFSCLSFCRPRRSLGQPAAALADIGQQLVELTARDPREFASVVQIAQLRKLSVKATDLDRALSRPPVHPRIEQALRAELIRLQHSIRPYSPADDESHLRAVRQLGDLLKAWPALMMAAADLRQKGIRLSQVVS